MITPVIISPMKVLLKIIFNDYTVILYIFLIFVLEPGKDTTHTLSIIYIYYSNSALIAMQL